MADFGAGGDDFGLATRLSHAGDGITDKGVTSVAPPIVLSSTYKREGDLSFGGDGHIYGRYGNPNRLAFERSMADLEGGAAGFAFASGLAAISSLLLSIPARAGKDGVRKVVLPSDTYHGTRTMLLDVFSQWRVEVVSANMRDAAARRAALVDADLVFLESPSNPLLLVTPLREVISEARELTSGVVAVDATWLTPALVQPLRLGADVAVHSTSKLIGGHSDHIGGCLVVKERGRLSETLLLVQRQVGAVMSPFDAWLACRGLRSLHVRAAHASNSAMQVATFLNGHPRVSKTHYPGLPSHPGHDTAREEQSGGKGLFGFMMAVEIEGEGAAVAFAANLNLFVRATSLGGTESLIEHRASVEGPRSSTPQSLLRISIGLEDPKDLIKDIQQALQKLPLLKEEEEGGAGGGGGETS